MNTHEHNHPTNDGWDDRELRLLLRDAVSDVRPEPALEALRARTGSDDDGHRSRPWFAVVAAAAAVAVIVGAISVVNRPTTPVVGRGHTATATSPSPLPAGPGPVESAMGIYYVGDTPQGPRLYREFHRLTVVTQTDGLPESVTQALGRASDPDYRDPWPARTHASLQGSTGDLVTLSLGNPDVDLSARPAGMSAAEARAAVQQLVYTAQAAVQDRRPVRFLLDGRASPTVLGVDTSTPVANLPQLDVLALVSITDPAEGAVVRGSFTASGVASSFEANVPWEIRQGSTVVKRGFSTASGWTDGLYPWATDPIDVSGLAPGSYTFVALTDDPSGGEGTGPMTDTRTIVVRR